jgi:hypothetical protein
VAERRDSANGKARRFSDEVGVGPLDRFPDSVSERRFVHSVGAAGDHQDRMAADAAAEDEGLGDLAHVATNGGRRFGGTACRLVQLANDGRDAEAR